MRRLDGLDDGLSMQPSDYFRRQVRVSSFAYELPRSIQRQLVGADLLMCCSDYPHSEGTAEPLSDYAAGGRHAALPEENPGLFCGNAAFLPNRDG